MGEAEEGGEEQKAPEVVGAFTFFGCRYFRSNHRCCAVTSGEREQVWLL